MQIQLATVAKDVKQINSSIVIIQPEFHLWSGRRAMKPQKLKELNPSGINLPPAGLASLGAIKLVHPDELKPFDSIKAEVQRKLAASGLQLFGGYAVHTDDFQSTYMWLKDQVVAFEEEKATMLTTLDQKIKAWVQDWVGKNPSYTHLLQDLPTAQTVFGKMSFDFHCYRVAAPTDTLEGETSKEYVRKIGGLSGELSREAAKEATVLMSRYLVNEKGNARDFVTQKTLGPIKRIAQRMRKFAFVDPSAGPLADLIDWTMQQVPEDGRVSGNALVAVWSMAKLIANPEEASRIGKFTQDNGPEAAWDFLCEETSAAAIVVEKATVTAEDATASAVNSKTESDSNVEDGYFDEPTDVSTAETKVTVAEKVQVPVTVENIQAVAIQPVIQRYEALDLFS